MFDLRFDTFDRGAPPRGPRYANLPAARIATCVAVALWTAWAKFNAPVPPAPVPLSLAGAGALAVNLTCAFLLARYRHQGGSLTRAAFLSARNDALANVAIIAAGLMTAYTLSAWPDSIPARSSSTFARGATQFVVQDALDTMWCSAGS